jgi:hypothetical protein
MWLDLKKNEITGTLPASVPQLFNLKMRSLCELHLQGSVPTTIGIPSGLKQIFPLKNHFSGAILSKLGLLTANTVTL